jgi:acyl carrier protein
VTEADVYAALKEIFRETFMEDDVVLTPTLCMKDIDGWDSFKQIEIIVAIEERFFIRMNSREVDSVQDVGDLIRVVAAKTAAA